jgi:Ni,Fe-hydrogenase I large subunit
VIVTRIGDRIALPAPALCWVPMPKNPTRRCTNPDPSHDGDHEHEYSGATWPRYKGEQRELQP